MTDSATTGGSDVPLSRQPDAQGQAALMLVESMLHALVDAGTFATDDALAIIAVAREVKEELGKTAHERPALIAESIGILDQIAISFATDQR